MESPKGDAAFRDKFISEFSDTVFQNAFKQYFSELGVNVKDWNGMFAEMNGKANAAYVRIAADGRAVGFIQFCPIKFTSCFFEGTCGFIREFWIADNFRGMGHGTALLRLAEEYFYNNGMFTSILTSDTAPIFYEKNGYTEAPDCKARNNCPVFVKQLK